MAEPVQEVESNEEQIDPEDIHRAPEDFEKMNIDQWEEFIKQDIPKFDGNVENAAFLLYYFSQGVEYTDKNFPIETTPDLVVVKTSLLQKAFVSNDESGFVLSQSRLEDYSKLDMNGTLSLTGDKEVDTIFSGTTGVFYWLGGAEERHHSWYREKNNLVGMYNDNTKPSSVVEYDSQEIEFEALLWQLECAKEKNFSDQIGILERRVKNAKIFRSKQEK